MFKNCENKGCENKAKREFKGAAGWAFAHGGGEVLNYFYCSQKCMDADKKRRG